MAPPPDSGTSPTLAQKPSIGAKVFSADTPLPDDEESSRKSIKLMLRFVHIVAPKKRIWHLCQKPLGQLNQIVMRKMTRKV